MNYLPLSLGTLVLASAALLSAGHAQAQTAAAVSTAGKPKAAPAQGQGQAFDGVGTVVAVLARQGRVVISHEAIKGYMGAMEMSFALASPDLANGIAEGDRIAFKLDVKGDAATVEQIRVLGKSR